MTETEKKALALLNECAGQEVYGGWGTFDPNQSPCTRALCRAIEQHEAFRQEVSDGVVKATHAMAAGKLVEASGILAAFIIAKTDPLVDLCYSMGLKVTGHELRAAIEARGGRIVWEGE